MARFKECSFDQGKFVPVQFHKQIHPGTFEYTLSYLIDHELDLSVFEQRYKNDDTGAPAYDPAILLKIILFAYSRGIVTSRDIAQACRENVIFMALSADTRPHYTTIADFITSMDREITELFRDVLLICNNMGLIGKHMFAVDGCKLPSNASKQWSGTRKDFQKKAKKLERAIYRILKKHREQDGVESDPDVVSQEKQYVKTLRSKVKKLKAFLKDNDDKIGKSGTPIKSNITDNESAKMKTSHGVIQGYNGVAMVDEKHQVIVHAEAFGDAQEHDLLEPMVQGTRENFQALDKDRDIFQKAKLTADSGFHSEKNMKMLSREGVDGYVADKLFRKRDPRFADADRYRERYRKERARHEGRSGLFRPRDFTFDPDLKFCLCPAGKRLYRNGGNQNLHGYKTILFRGPKSACVPCELRTKCLRHPDRSKTRQVHYFLGRSKSASEKFTEKMKRKIDSVKGRFLYNKRMGTVEPVFGNLRYCKKLDRFTLRGKHKVNSQWLLFCILHNLGKVHRYGSGFA